MPTPDKEFLIRVKADIERAVKDMSRLSREIKKQGKDADAANKPLGKQAALFDQMKAAAGAYVSIAGAIKALRLADEFQQINIQVQQATRATGDYVAVSQDLYAVSQRNGVALRGTVELFRGLSRSAQELGASNDDVLRVVESIQQLAVMSGAGPGALANAMLQFSQAMAGGVFRAEELNSIIEHTPAVAERIARGMGMTVGQLRLAVLEGRILAQDAFGSLLKQTDAIAAEMAGLPETLSRSMARLDNAWMRFIGQAAEASGIVENLSFFLNEMARSADESGGSLGGFLAATGLLGSERMFEQQSIAAKRRREAVLAEDQKKIDALRADLAKLDAAIDEKASRLLAMDPVSTSKASEQLGAELVKLRQAQSDLLEEIEAAEAAFGKMGDAGKQAAALTADEQKRLTVSLEQVKRSLGEQLALWRAQVQAIGQAEARVKTISDSFRDAAAAIAEQGKADSRTGGLDIQQQILAARQALAAGDLDAAIKGAEAARDLIVDVARAGDESGYVLRYLLGQAAEVAEEASQGLADQQTKGLEAIKAKIGELLAEGSKLKQLKLGFDEAAASAESEQLRTTLQQQFDANPLRLPVILQPQQQPSDLRTVIDRAIEQLPGKAAGGLLRGPGSGTSDSMLARVSNGEFVVSKRAVDHYGSKLFYDFNAMALPRFAAGGLVKPLPVSQPAGVPGQNLRPAIFNLNGENFKLYGDDDAVRAMGRAFERQALKRGRLI